MEIYSAKTTAPKTAGPSKTRFCMICLNTSKECKLYPGMKYNLDLEFENLTGITLQGDAYFTPQFCPDCAHRLYSCSRFRDRSLKAYHLLLGLVEMNLPLTEQSISSIRRANNITPLLTKKSFKPGHFDSYVTRKEEDKEVQVIEETLKNETTNKLVKIEVKLLDGKLLSPDNKDENNVEEEIDEEVVKAPKIVKEPKLEIIEDDIDIIDDEGLDNISDFEETTFSDIEGNKKAKERVNKFKKNIMNDTDNDWDFLKDSSSDTDDSMKPLIKAIAGKMNSNEKIRKRPARKRKLKQKVRDPAWDEYLKYFDAKELSREEQMEEIHKRKETENFVKALYKCMTCFKIASNSETYKAHMEKHTDKYGSFECSLCKLRFKSGRAARGHEVNSHGTRYSCRSCPFVTHHKLVADNHANFHKGTTYQCPHCPEELRSKTGYFSHLRLVHPTDIVCTLCGYSFMNERGLVQHVNYKHHGETAQYPDGPLCEPCNIRFASATAYMQHLEVSPKHTAAGRRRRNTPRKVYKNQNIFSQNYRNKPTVTCEECGTQLEGYVSYNRHFRREHPNKTRGQYPRCHAPSLCEQCGRSFRNRYALRDHMLQHSGKKDFQCDICKKTYYLKTNLALHLKTHSDQQPEYSCPVCDKKFLNKANCNRHVWVHEERKPYKCTACEKTFVNASSLRAHVEHAHLKKPYPKKIRGPRLRASRARHTKEPVCGTIWPKAEHSAGVMEEFPASTVL